MGGSGFQAQGLRSEGFLGLRVLGDWVATGIRASGYRGFGGLGVGLAAPEGFKE